MMKEEQKVMLNSNGDKMKNSSLRTSLYRVFAGSVLIPFILISLILLVFFDHQILQSYQDNNRIILQTIISHLDNSLQNSERFFLQYLFDDSIAGFYQYVDRNEIDASEENLYQYMRKSSKYRSSVNNYLTTSYITHRGIGFIPQNANSCNLFYLPKYGSTIIRYQNESDEMEQMLRNLEKLTIGEVIFFPDSLMEGCEEYGVQENIFTMLRPVNRLETASRQGYVFLELDRSIFSDLAREITLPEGAGLVIVFPDGTSAYATDEKFILDSVGEDERTEVMGEKVQIEGKTHYLYRMKEEEYGFYVDYLLPHSTILQEANRTTFMILLFWFGAIAASFFLFVSLSRKISASAAEIMTYIQKYRLGDGENRRHIPQMSIEEFDEIFSALTEMTSRISDSLEREYIWKMNQQMAEYKAMQAEINPHFFNNVMSSLQALNRMGDTKKLDRSILNLSRMFRYTCEPGYDSSIARECQFIESYLMLEKLRFEERLHYEIRIEEGLEEFAIPKLLLQPLVENAMHHGMSEDGKPLSILLQICKMEGKNGDTFVWIVLANDGIPYKEETLFTGDRVGIRNVKERLSITYPCSFFWYDRKGSFQTICNMLILVK